MGMDNVFDDFRRNTKCLINVPNKNVIRKSIFMVEFHTSSLLLLSRISHLPSPSSFRFMPVSTKIMAQKEEKK